MKPDVLNLSTFGEIIKRPQETPEPETRKEVAKVDDLKDDGYVVSKGEEDFNNKLQSVVKCVLEYTAQIKLYHWQTEFYEEHKTLNKFYNLFGDLTDNLIETVFGKYGRISLDKEACGITLKNYPAESDNKILEFLSEMEDCYKNVCKKKFSPNEDSEIINIIDEILALIQKTKYLLTLK